MSALEIRTFPGAGGGMDQAAPIHMLADSKARWIVDGMVDRPGLIRQRGKIKGTQISTREPLGLMHTYQPDGTLILAAHVTDEVTTNGFQFLTADNGTLGTASYGGNYSATGPPTLFDAKPSLKGPGQTFGFAPNPLWGLLSRGLGFWRGGSRADYSTGTLTVAQGATAVSGSGTTWSSSNISPGMFVFADLSGGNYSYLGVVKTLGTNTTLTLESGSLFAATTANYLITSIRGISPRISVGRISGATGQTTINGSGTKFLQIGAGSTWALFRQRDMAFIGNVSTITSDTQLVLAANAAVATANDKYVAIKISDKFTVYDTGIPVGVLNAVWNNRQFYANASSSLNPDYPSRVWYSDLDDGEALDLTSDGWNLDVPSTEGGSRPILALLPTPDALLIFKETEVFTLRGDLSDPTSVSVDKISDNGLLSTDAVCAYGTGAIWASDRGIMQFDGSTTRNITKDSLGDLWTKAMQNYSPINGGIHAMIERDHFFLHIEGFWDFPTGTGYYKSDVEYNPSYVTWCVNLETEAITMLRNVGIRASTTLSAAGTQEATTRFLVKKGSDGTSWICKAITLFTDEGTSATTGGVDDFACAGHTAGGPDFYIESARYDMDDPQIKKLWKQLQIYYQSISQQLVVEVMQDFVKPGTALGSTLAPQSVITNKRIKFLKRGNLIGFRLYIQSGNPGSGTPPTEVMVGPWAIGFKRQRPGRV